MKEPRVTWNGSLSAQREYEQAVIEANQRRARRIAETPPQPMQKKQVARKSRRKGKKGRRPKFISYQEYIRSAEWKRRAKQAIEHYGGKCAICGSKDRLEVHHKTYQRLGRERMKDLEVLCSGCHGIEHEDKYTPRDDLTQRFLAIVSG